MTSLADEQFNSAQHEKERASVSDSWTQALRNELGLLESQLAAGLEGREHADLERRIGEVKTLLGDGRAHRRTAVARASGAQTRES